MQTLLQDLKFGWRVLRKSPGFALMAILVLALGIGANTAIFSVVNTVLLRPLPLVEADRLVHVWHVPPQTSFPGMSTFSVSPANFLDWRSQNHVFEGMATSRYGHYTLTGTGHPESLWAVSVSPDYFPIMREQPILGRLFMESEHQPGHDHEVVLSNEIWRTRFQSRPDVVGKSVELNGESYAIVGVMGPRFGPAELASREYRPQMWTPLAWTSKEQAVRDNHNYTVIARLKPGVTVAQAQAEMNTISSRLQQQYPADDKGWGATVIGLREDIVGDVKPALLILLGAVAFVLLISCANVANLVLAKTLSRKKEVAIRTALGASRRRVLQQVLSETVLMALTGGILGLILAHYGIILIVRFLGNHLPRAAAVGVDGWVLAFTAVISLVAGLAAGLLPALRLTHENVSQALRQGLGRTASDSGGNRTRSVLVVAEVALSLMLLVGAGLMIRSLLALRSVNPGFDANHVVTMSLAIPPTKFSSAAQQISFYGRVLERVRTLPGVDAAGVTDDLPLRGGSHQPVQVEGQPVVPMSDQPEVDVRLISPGFISAMRVPVLQGRDLDASDVAGRPGAVLISQSMAKRFWPHEDPIGKHLTLYFTRDLERVVVGVVGDVKMDALSQTRPTEALYTPLAQVSPSPGETWHSFGMDLAVRTHGEPSAIVAEVSDAVHQIDSEVPLLSVSTMQDIVSESVAPQRFTMQLLAAFAGLAVVLAAIGIYSVLSYAVRRRTSEIGIRMALGAQISDVIRMIVSDGMKPTLLGIGIGLAGALALARVVASVIYGVSVRDVATYASVSVLLAFVGLAASLVPALRASRVEPVKTLREE